MLGPTWRWAPQATSLVIPVLAVVVSGLAAQSRPDSAPATRPSRIIGQVLRPDGTPAPGATVRVFRKKLPFIPRMFSNVLPDAQECDGTEITCGPDGGFRVHAPAGELYGLLALDGEELMSTFAGRLCAGDSAVLRLGPLRKVEGRVLIVEEGKEPSPAEERRVVATLQMPQHGLALLEPVASVETLSGPAGAFSLRVPQESNCSVAAFEGGRARARAYVAKEDRRAVELRILARRPVHGMLRDKDTGKPVAGAQVFWGARGTPRALSDAEGRFELPRDDDTSWIHIIPRSHERTFALMTAPQLSGAEDVEVRLTPSRLRLSARLLREDGTPMGPTRVVFSGRVRAGDREMDDAPWVHQLPADGRLEIECLQPGQLTLAFVEADGRFVRFLATSATEEITLGDVKISTRGLIAGRVIGADGAPCPGAVVRAQPYEVREEPLLSKLGPYFVSTYTDRTGRFFLDGMKPGRCKLGVFAPGRGYAIFDTSSETGAEPVVLPLAEGEVVAGRVVDPKGAAVPGAYVNFGMSPDVRHPLSWFDRGILLAVTDEKGRFRMSGLSSKDRLELFVAAPGGLWSRDIPVVPGTDVDIEIVVEPRK